jgi:hypothetical protein
VLRRRSHFGSKSVRGTEIAAILYSLVETANVCGIDPIAYLVEVATRARRSPGGRPTSCRLQSHQRRRVNGARLLWPVCRVTTGYGGKIRKLTAAVGC